MSDLYRDLTEFEYDAVKAAEKNAGNTLVGRFGLKAHASWFMLLGLSEFDREFVSGVRVKDGEVIYRYVTATTAACGMCILIKINFERRLVYFLTQDALDQGYVEFESRAEKAPWIILGNERRTAA